MSPDATRPPEAWAAWADGLLHFAFVEGGGSIIGPVSGTPPLMRHPAVRGKIAVAGRDASVLEAVRASTTGEELIRHLAERGFDVRRTPAVALQWLLQDLLPWT